MKLEFKIARRFLSSSKVQTLLIIMGIAIGVSVQVFIGSLIQGLQKNLVDQTVGNSSQITVISKSEDKTITDWEALVSSIESLENLPSRITVVSPTAESPVFIPGISDVSALLRGLDFERANKIYKLDERIIGTLPEAESEILIGKELADELSLGIGKNIELLTSRGARKTFKITGIFDLEVASINRSWVITNLKSAQNLFEFENKITSIEMQAADVFKADEVGTILESSIDVEGIKIDNWKSQNGQLLSGLSGQSISSLMIQIFVLVAVALGISSVLAISVVQKSRQIGILKAMGIKDSSASLIFLFQGLMLGVIGAVLGVLFGMSLSYAFTKFAVTPEGNPVVPLNLNYWFIALSGLIAIAVAIIAALVPARRSSRLSPVEVIKNG